MNEAGGEGPGTVVVADNEEARGNLWSVPMSSGELGP